MRKQTLVLVVQTEGSDQTLSGERVYRVGRDPASDVVLSDPRISWHHAVLRLEDDAWILEDMGSTNGIFAGNIRLQRMQIDDGSTFRFGDPDDGTVVHFSLSKSLGRYLSRSLDGRDRRPRIALVDSQTTALNPTTAKPFKIGRAVDNDIIVADLSISRHHAELRYSGAGGYEIVDLGSHNGTFVNGTRVSTARITELDIVGIGPSTFRLAGHELREFIDEGDVSLIAHDLTIRIAGCKLLPKGVEP